MNIVSIFGEYFKIMKTSKINIVINIFVWLLFISSISAQDTLKMMHYNLMQYLQNPYGGCTSANNSLDLKDANLKIIIPYAKPDIITVNEIGVTQAHVTRILNNVLNVNGVNYWKAGQLTSQSGGTIANMMFYDSRKLTLKSSSSVPTSYRDFNIYRLYFNTPDLEQGDTVFFVSIVCHLKAGTTDTAARYTMIQSLMSKLNSWGVSDNYVLSGDFNIYTSNESFYQLLLNYPNAAIRFFDPINTPGNWNNNSQFKNVHTQSTHTGGDCFSTGGMDDRFDHIMVSSQVLNGFENVKVLPSTYHALGQDGNRFNGSIVSPTNNSIPTELANALYNMSDHLPVLVDFLVYYTNAGIAGNSKSNIADIKTQNPFENEIKLFIKSQFSEKHTYSLVDSRGVCVTKGEFNFEPPRQEITLVVPKLSNGIYFLKVESKTSTSVLKLIYIQSNK